MTGGSSAAGGTFRSVRRIIERLRAYSGLVMLGHMLFSLPFAAAAVLWACGGLPPVGKALWIFIALFGARNGANALNRVIDRKFDAANPRTSPRHIPSGRVRASEGLAVAAVCFALYFIAAFMLSPVCGLLSPLPFAIFTAYSYTKRITCLCHFVLGAAVGGAPLAAWIAITGRPSVAAFLLSCAVGFWVTGFDMLYALEDIAFDRAAELHSIPAAVGAHPAIIVASLCHLSAAVILTAAVYVYGGGWIAYAGVGFCAILLACEIALAARSVRAEHTQDNRAASVDIRVYLINQLVGVSFFLFVVFDFLLV